MSLGKRLQEVRTKAGLTQNAFGEHLGISGRGYKNYERGTRDVPASLIVRICEEYGVSANWLLLGNGENSTQKLADVILKAKQSAQKYIDKNKRNYSEREIAEIEAVFQNYIQDQGRPRDEALDELMRELPNGTI